MNRVRAIVLASPTAALALAAFVFAWAGDRRTETHWAAWEWVIVGAVFLLASIARYADEVGRAAAAHRVSAGRCPACGYDLRATPRRCPECGWVTLHA